MMAPPPPHPSLSLSLTASPTSLFTGEYVTLYQNQREALRAKSREKDHFIQQLMAEKDVVQVTTTT